MEHTEFGASKPQPGLEHVQDELDRAFPGLGEDEENSGLFGVAAEDEPDHLSAEPGGLIDMKNLD